jgi:hypothetical protein
MPEWAWVLTQRRTHANAPALPAQAEMCVRQAEQAKTPRHRMILLQLAQTWLHMADEAEAINKKFGFDDLDRAS